MNSVFQVPENCWNRVVETQTHIPHVSFVQDSRRDGSAGRRRCSREVHVCPRGSESRPPWLIFPEHPLRRGLRQSGETCRNAFRAVFHAGCVRRCSTTLQEQSSQGRQYEFQRIRSSMHRQRLSLYTPEISHAAAAIFPSIAVQHLTPITRMRHSD